MRVIDVITELQKYDPEKELIVFAEGNLYPTFQVQDFEGEIELGCGWDRIKNTLEEDT